MSVRRGQENQWSLRRFERAVMMWTWPANSHTGPRHVTIAAMIRPDTCQHPIMRSLSQKFFLQRRGRPHMTPVPGYFYHGYDIAVAKQEVVELGTTITAAHRQATSEAP